ncbi:sigma-70 family RNA polymerase sigma factor [Flammeovirga sp. OC4]|uniref:sigma-70 family RNA polymerase sigma factor n=1 Tax=Flammeovirga sp. OC4 TaxID=1382345 RepID=UPI0005C4BF47|nr:sigma-70 family RNA polymerase sigma factor [Flammeovirga sp. OC4]
MNTKDIWNNFHQELEGFITSKVNEKDEVQDILQDVFIKIHEKKALLKDEQQLESWIYQITRNSIIDFYRKRKNNQTFDVDQVDLPQEFNGSDSNLQACEACVKPFILQLPEKYQDVLMKVTYHRVSQKEYAHQHQLSYSAVKSRVQRGREQLKQSFETCCTQVDDGFGNITFNCKSGNCN